MQVLDRLQSFLSRRSEPAYLVGGSVRDLLLHRERYDVDVAVMGNASAMARAFADEIRGAFYVMDDANDVARVVYESTGNHYFVDLARMRGESIEQDLATRDFTINAMAVDISHGARADALPIDPFGGRADLAARRLRAVASSIFENDSVRLIRGARFEATLGFGLEPETEGWLRRDAHQLVDAAPERVRDEFYKIISADSAIRNLHRLDELGLLRFLLPEITDLKGITQSAPHTYDVFEHSIQAVGAFEDLQKARFLPLAEGAFSDQLELHLAESLSGGRQRGMLLRVALLLHDAGKLYARTEESEGRLRFFGHEIAGEKISAKALRRMRFSNDEIALVSTIAAHHLRPILLALGHSVSDRAVYRYFRATGDAGVDIAIHSWCDQRATFGDTEYSVQEAELQAVIARLLDRYYHAHDKAVDPPTILDGRDVMHTLSIGSGPRVGELLDALREAQAAGEVGTREQAVQFIRTRHRNGNQAENPV